MLSITGVTDCCSPNCHSEGCPSPATAAPPLISTAAVVVAKMVDRLSTGIVGFAPSNEALRHPPHRISPIRATAAARVERDGRQGRLPRLVPWARVRRNLRGILASQTTIPASSQCTSDISPCDQKSGREGHANGAFLTLSRPQCAALLIVDTSVRP